MGIFKLVSDRKKEMEKKMRDAGVGSPTGGLRGRQPIKPQKKMQPVRQKKAVKPCPVWIRDEDCARMGYKAR